MPVTPPAGATKSSLIVASYNPLNDTWTSVLDLNDQITYWSEITLTAPEKVFDRAENPRTQGQRVTVYHYRNRQVQVGVSIRGADPATIMANKTALVQAIEGAPYTLVYAYPKATQYSYFDVVAVTHDLDVEPKRLLGGALKGKILFECRPGIRGDRLTLQNLVPNPGFEAPAGGGIAQTMPVVFNDAFANANAYAVQAGAALGQDKAYFTDTIMKYGPLRYYRLGEVSGTVAKDGSRFQSGTYTGGFTLGAASLLTGDTNGAVTFNGTTGYVSVPTTGLPTGNGAWALIARVQPAAGTNATDGVVLWMGSQVAGQAAFVAQVATGGWRIGTWGGAGNDSGALGTSTAATAYTLHAEYDGAGTLTLYINGVSAGTVAVTARSLTLGTATIGSSANGTSLFFNGVIDETVFVGAALGATAAAAIHTAATTTPATVSQSLLLATGNRVSFGSPAWGAVQTWQQRFRWFGGGTSSWWLHWQDANNKLGVTLTNTTLALVHVVGGVTNTLASVATVTPVSETPYWLKLTQFTGFTGDSPNVQATLLNDAGNAPGTVLATVGPVAAFNATTAMSGAPQFETSGASMGVGGAFTNVHTLSLFGPGGWASMGQFGTGPVSGAWDGIQAGAPNSTNANTYPNGPVTSFGALRLDYPPAGTASVTWTHYNGGAPAGTPAIPVAAAGNALGVSGWVKSSGLHATNGSSSLILNEYDASGAFLRQTTVQTRAGSLTNAGWTQVSGTVTTGANCAYVSLACESHDTAVAAESANAVVWFENLQVWNQTTTGQASMPYCELRFPNSPAQLLVSGLLGDLPSPAWLGLGTYYAAAPGASTQFKFALGRRAQVSAGAQLALVVADGTSNQVLDATAYGGCYAIGSLTITDAPTVFAPRTDTLLGVYHLYGRLWTNQAGGNLGNLTLKADVQTALATFRSGIQTIATVQIGPPATPFAASSTWTIADAGQVQIPLVATGSLVDPAQSYTFVIADLRDSTGGGSTMQQNWALLLPVDASLVLGSWGGGNVLGSYTTQWWWLYNDGLGAASPASTVGWTWGHEATPSPNPKASAGAVGSQGTLFGVTYPALPTSADPYVLLDPALDVGTNMGVNQFGGYIADQAGAVQALYAEMQYTPLYLDPR